jgi:hypothetical protein
MPRGGRRDGSGRKSTWVSGCKFEDTKLIRVPVSISDKVLKIAHKLDSGESIDLVAKLLGEIETKSIESLEKENKSLKQSIAVLQSRVLEMGSNTSLSNNENPQQLDIFSSIKSIDRALLHRLRDQVLKMNILSVGKQSNHYQETVRMLNKFISLLLKEL